MPIEEDIDAFYVWATKLGCPQEALPSEDALKPIFKSRQRDVFCNLMKRVRPREEVQAIRENILIKRMRELKNQVVPVSTRSYLPKELQTYLKVKDLEKKKNELVNRLNEKRKDFEKLESSIKTRNIRIIDLEHKRDTVQAKCDILDFKLEDLNNNIKKEQQNKVKILDNMPVQITAENAKEQIAMDAVNKALQELQQFYKHYENQNASVQNEMRSNLWAKIRKIFANIPNCLLFNAIMRLKDDNLQSILNLRNGKMDAIKQQHSGSFSSISKEPFSPFEEKLLQTKAELLGVIAQYQAAKHQLNVSNAQFTPAYNAFVDELKKKVCLFNSDIEEPEMDDIITEYLIQLNLRTFKKTQNEFLTQQIEQYKLTIDGCAKQLENHDKLLGTIKQLYTDINDSINRIHLDMLQLSQVKDKIAYTKNLMLNQIMLQNSKASTTSTAMPFNMSKLKINNCNLSLLGAESFSIGNDCVLSSTALDFDASINPLSVTMLSRSFSNADLTLVPATAGAGTGPNSALPPHVLELMTFNETPLQKLSWIPKELAFYLSPNPLIVESTEITSTLQLAPGILLTPFGALQEVQKQIKWAELIAAHSNDLKLDLDLITVDANAFKQRIKEQRERISELLDKVDVICVNSNHMLRKLVKYYDFILENPLRHYIPATKCFCNQTYADFEAEYLMYYRMATVGTSITSTKK